MELRHLKLSIFWSITIFHTEYQEKQVGLSYMFLKFLISSLGAVSRFCMKSSNSTQSKQSRTNLSVAQEHVHTQFLEG